MSFVQEKRAQKMMNLFFFFRNNSRGEVLWFFFSVEIVNISQSEEKESVDRFRDFKFQVQILTKNIKRVTDRMLFLIFESFLWISKNVCIPLIF